MYSKPKGLSMREIARRIGLTHNTSTVCICGIDGPVSAETRRNDRMPQHDESVLVDMRRHIAD